MGQRVIFLILCFMTLIQYSNGQTRAKAFAAPTGPNALDVEGSDKTFFMVTTRNTFRPRPQPPRTLATQRPPQFIPTRAPPPAPLPRQNVRPTQPPPVRQPFRPQPPVQQPFRPQTPVQQPFRPQHPVQQPFRPQAPVQQPFRPQAPVQRPLPPSSSFTPRLVPTQPPQGFRPQSTPAPFRPQLQTQRPFRPAPRTQPAQPFRPQQPFRPRIPPRTTGTTPSPRPLRPFGNNNRRPFRPSTQRPNDPTGLRTGTCPFTIFYQSGPASQFDAQQTYTHFAVVVSIDQCARTCHEFNCAMAFFDSINKHCQFNVGNNRVPQNCPAYPSPFLRNNVPLSAVPLRITCITCQRRRRRNRTRSRFFTSGFSQRRRQFQPQIIGRSVSNVIHGVLLRQPQSVAIGFGESVSRQAYGSFFRESSFHSSGELVAISTTAPSEAQKYTSTEVPDFSSAETTSPSEASQIAGSNLFRLNMQKLFPSEASEDSTEELKDVELHEVIDDSAGDEPLDLRVPESKKPVAKKLLHKTTGLSTTLQRIQAADKILESSEFA